MNRLLIGFLAALFLLIGVGFLSWRNSVRLAETHRLVAHTHEILQNLEDLQRRLSDAEAGQRGFLLTGEESFLAPYKGALKSVREMVVTLKTVTADNPTQQKSLEEMGPLIEQRIEIMDRRIHTRRTEGLASVTTPTVLREGEQLMNDIGRLNDRMEEEETRLLQIRRAAAEETFQRFARIGSVAGIVSVVIFALIFAALMRENANRRESEKALAASELRFRSLTENVKDYAIFMLDSEGKVATWSKGAEKFKGYKSEEIIGKHFSTFYPPEDLAAKKPERELGTALAEGRVEDEGWRVRKDGSRFWAYVTITALRDKDGNLLGFSKITRDMTERKKAEEKLKETVDELNRSNAELEQFAYVASHDLQEPLRAVSGCVQILQRRYTDKLDAKASELIQHAVEGSVRMQTLINDLLAYSRVSSKAQPLEEVDSGKVLKNTLLNLRAAIEESHAQVIYNGLPAVFADPAQLSQLFQNLVGNALKYRGDLPPEIRVDAVLEDDAHWRFAVRDNGIGIEPQYFERIFRLFQRLHTRREYTGTGIGLALCKKIVERHGGRIWVESKPEKGSTFYFTLPAIKKL